MEQEANGQRVPGGGDDSGEAGELKLEIVDSLSAIDPAAWDALLGDGDDASPFLEHRFLQSLEDAGTLGEAKGWIPRYPLVWRGERLIGAAPAYVKLHSQGEFVFDWGWADVAMSAGIRYYPKLLIGVPFTPVTGRRLLTAPDEDRPALMELLGGLFVELCDHMSMSSAHVNFATQAEVEALEAVGFLRREGIQYHWFRHGDDDHDAYLARFTSKRRNQIKRECRAPKQQGIEIRTLTGDELDSSVMDVAFALYKSTIDKFHWGRQYLNRDLFELLCERMADRTEIVVAKRGDEVLAGAVNFAKNKRLYGRYWGCFSEVKHLHFNVCYYHGVQRCLELGRDAFEPGAQGGTHKLPRGFEPTIMHSAHHLVDERLREVIGRHLLSERLEMQRHKQMMLDAMKRKGSTSNAC